MRNTTLEMNLRPEERFISAFEVNEGHTLNGHNPTLHGLRQSAMARFTTLGFPAPRTEAWKYTNISKALKHPYQIYLKPNPVPVTAADVAALRVPGLGGPLAVFVNGRFSDALSALEGLPEDVVVCGLGHASETQTNAFNQHFSQYADHHNEPLTALNTAFTQDGLFVYVPRNVIVETPIEVISVLSTAEDLFVQPRHLVVVEQGASVQVIEQQHTLTPHKTFTNAVCECYVGANAQARIYKVQDGGAAASTVDTVHAYQEADSTFTIHTTTLSGALVRNNLSLLPNAENCETHMFGLFLGDGTMHVDNHTLVDHAKPHCFSNELYKGILNDKATGVFNGKVLVRQDAQKINAYQSNKTVVLTDTAHMYAKPELEIYADDVKCSHGATTGQVDPEALFYLRSRGLSEQQARTMLLQAFARDVLDNIHIPPLHDHLDALVAQRLR